MTILEDLQALFRELFQSDLADLDFGYYKLLHLKRAEIDAFLTSQLPKEVDQAFAVASKAERSTAEREVQELASRIRHEIADDAISPTGERGRRRGAGERRPGFVPLLRWRQ